MNLRIISLIAFGLFVLAGIVVAQELPKMPEPVKEHQWLQKFVGEWDTQSKAKMGPDQPPMECSGTISSRSLGGFWVINEMQGDMQGTPMIGVQTVGYDVEKKKYVGSWVDSMTAHYWQYEGDVNKQGNTLTLEAEGPNFMADGKLTKYQDIYKFKSADEIAITSRMLGEDGEWIEFMSGTAKREQ